MGVLCTVERLRSLPSAEKRAAELKCKGVFAMGSLWMPCANERALHDALQKAQ